MEVASVCRFRMRPANYLSRFGREHEWHLVVPNSFRHFTFQHPARLHHLVELDWRAFSLSRFKSVRSISDAVKCDGVEQLLVEGGTERRATASLKVNQRLKRFQRLQRPFEADRPRLHSVLRRRLRHDRADEIVGENVRPDFFVDEFRRLAAQHVHFHRGLDRSQIELVVPAGAIQTGKVFLGRFHWVEQGRDDDNGLRSKSRLLDAKASFANRHVLRKGVVR